MNDGGPSGSSGSGVQPILGTAVMNIGWQPVAGNSEETPCELFLFNLFQLFSTSALAGRLADRVAFAPSAARTDIFAHHRKRRFLSLDLDVGFIAFNLGDFGLHHFIAARTFAGASRDRKALAALATTANIDLIPHLEIDFASLDRRKTDRNECQGKNDSQTNAKHSLHSVLLSKAG